MALLAEARRAEIERARSLISDGNLLLIYGPWPEEAADVATVALRSLAAIEIARIDVAACSDDRDLSASLVRAAASVMAGEAVLFDTPPDAMSPAQLRTVIRLRRALGVTVDSLLSADDSSERVRPSEVAAAVVSLLDSTGAALVVDSADQLAVDTRSRFEDSRSFLWSLRSAAQHASSLPIVFTGGPAASRLVEERDQAFLGWGRPLRLDRVASSRLTTAIQSASEGDVASDLAYEIAECAAGAPWVADLLLRQVRRGRSGRSAVRTGWDELVEGSSPNMAITLRTAAELHRAAHAVCVALALARPPYGVGTASDVNRALHALQRNAVVESPEPRHWDLCDPIFAEWLRRLSRQRKHDIA